MDDPFATAGQTCTAAQKVSGQDIELKPDAPFSWEHKKMPAAVRQAFLCVCGNQSSGWATTLVARTPLAPRGSGSVSKVTF